MSIIDRANQIDGKEHILDSAVKKSDFLQFVPARVTGVANSYEAMISKPSNDYHSNLIQVSLNIWKTDISWSNTDLRKVRPLMRGFSDSITIGESVLVTELGGQLYYLGPLNISNNPTYNYDTMTGGNLDEDFEGPDYFETSVSFPQGIKFKRLNKNFKPELDDPKESIERLSHPETGNEVFSDLFTDLVLEGRFGNSLRLGSRNINPYVFISNGRNDTQKEESINDGSILALIEQGSIFQHFQNEAKDDEPYEFKLADEELESPTQTIRTTFLTSLGRGLGIYGEDDSDVEETIYEYS